MQPLKVNRRFGGTYHRTRYQRESSDDCILIGLLDPEDGGDVAPKSRLPFKGLHCIITQKTVLFITAAVRTLDPEPLHVIPNTYTRQINSSFSDRISPLDTDDLTHSIIRCPLYPFLASLSCVSMWFDVIFSTYGMQM
jgi:hypothetical protein